MLRRQRDRRPDGGSTSARRLDAQSTTKVLGALAHSHHADTATRAGGFAAGLETGSLISDFQVQPLIVLIKCNPGFVGTRMAGNVVERFLDDAIEADRRLGG